MPKGSVELENWLTWKTNQADDPGLEEFDLRHEIEFGVTDRLQLPLYFADWTHEHRPAGDKTDFSDVAVEAIYNLTDPNTTAFGSEIYGEIKGSDDFFELKTNSELFGMVTASRMGGCEATLVFPPIPGTLRSSAARFSFWA